jgi:hypothetical protein
MKKDIFTHVHCPCSLAQEVLKTGEENLSGDGRHE